MNDNYEVDEVPQKEYEVPREGEHEASVHGTKNLGEQDYGFGKSMKMDLLFELTDEWKSDGTPFVVSRLCGLTMHPKGALFEIVSELLGSDPPPNFKLSTLKGRACKVKVVHKKGSGGGVFANVGKVRRVENPSDIASRERIAKVKAGLRKSAHVPDATDFRIEDLTN